MASPLVMRKDSLVDLAALVCLKSQGNGPAPLLVNAMAGLEATQW